MANRIDIPNWYQLDFKIIKPKSTLKGIVTLMNKVGSEDLVDKWFYLFEGSTIRVRMHSLSSKTLEGIIKENATKIGLAISLQCPFEGYWETTDAFEDVIVAETFANVMSSLTALTITRLSGKQMSNYRLVERLSHCIFNNVYGLPTEEYFLLKRLFERCGGNLGNLNDNPEQTVLDDNIKIGTTQGINITIPVIKVPIK